MMVMAENLFSEFHSSHRSDWEKQMVQEIKQPLSELRNCNPLYPHECLPYFSHEEYDQLRFAELRNSQRKDTGWLNMPAIEIKNIAGKTRKINEKLNAGAQAILLKTENNPVEEIENILINIDKKDVPVFISSEQDPEALFEAFQSAHLSLKGGIANDPLANWMRCAKGFDQNLSGLAQLCSSTNNIPGFYPIMIDGHVYHEAGVTPEQELAMVLASFVFYLDKLTDSGLSPLASNNIFFSLSIGTDYLSEIAKLRALRMLHSRILEAYHCQKSEIPHPFIHTETSRLYYSATTEHTNIIRATSEAMSAVTGGSNALTIHPFDYGNDFSERIAMNISSVIAYESGIGQIADPASGSYFLDNRSQMMAEMAWNLFLEIENQGGIIDSFKNGFVQNLANTSWSAKVNAMREVYVMVGVNRYNTFSKNNVEVTTKKKVADGLLTSRNLSSSWYSN
ncbi:hypothetical protein DSL64_17645 [Dyadobacter luteus]|uniref:Methylmalonyl-CoA mutase alpha/beta chain catalytic domain-containing protein n=2 Tax=Dyadobacter luteus TaxID=2259619 RepID=A0A3D8Y8C6_9BACT|nr:hypothetical protein DSL64_17645 [Dyadobacter luteus]